MLNLGLWHFPPFLSIFRRLNFKTKFPLFFVFLSQYREEDSSSSDDEEEMVERCNWRQTRQQLKQDLSEQGATAATKVLGASANKGLGTGKANYVKPPRVINLQVGS